MKRRKKYTCYYDTAVIRKTVLIYSVQQANQSWREYVTMQYFVIRRVLHITPVPPQAALTYTNKYIYIRRLIRGGQNIISSEAKGSNCVCKWLIVKSLCLSTDDMVINTAHFWTSSDSSHIQKQIHIYQTIINQRCTAYVDD